MRPLRGALLQSCLLPFYHVISDERLPHIENLYRVKSVREFRRDIEWLLRHFEPVDLPTFMSHLVAGEPFSRPSMLLTFDDGLSECSEVIAPVLLELGVPAVFFLNSGFVDNAGLFFRYKVSLLLGAGADKHDDGRPLLQLRHSDMGWIDAEAERRGVDFGGFLRKQQPYMTSAQVRQLIEDGFHVGAHSVDHPEYQYLTLEEQVRQTRDSMDEVQARFDLDYRAFSFPFTDYGVSRAFFERVYAEGIADATFACAGVKSDGFRQNQQRVAMEAGALTAEQIVKTELLYARLLRPFGKTHLTHD